MLATADGAASHQRDRRRRPPDGALGRATAAAMSTILRRIYTASQDFIFGGAICAVGDVAAQLIESKRWDDSKRTAVVSAYGAAVCYPYHKWYQLLGYAFPGQSFHAVARKTACEMLIALTLFEVPAFTVFTGFFARGETLQESFAALRQGWAQAVVAGWAVWGPASCATFGLIVQPRNQMRVMYGCGAIWACVISWLSFDAVEHKSVERKPAAGDASADGEAYAQAIHRMHCIFRSCDAELKGLSEAVNEHGKGSEQFTAAAEQLKACRLRKEREFGIITTRCGPAQEEFRACSARVGTSRAPECLAVLHPFLDCAERALKERA